MCLHVLVKKVNKTKSVGGSENGSTIMKYHVQRNHFLFIMFVGCQKFPGLWGCNFDGVASSISLINTKQMLVYTFVGKGEPRKPQTLENSTVFVKSRKKQTK